MDRLPNLDPLRFFLASLVICFHTPQLCRNQGLPYFLDAPIFNRGTEAVYMFFVLSGFLIIRLIYRYKQRDDFSIRKFYIRRILRIFPLYYLIVAFGFLFYWLILPALHIPFENNYNLGEGVLLATFFLPNVFSKLYMPGGILEVLWSIGIEEQFYIIIAPLLYMIRKHKIVMILVLLTVVYFIVYHLDGLEVLRRYKFVYFFLFSGGIIAILEEKKYLEFLKRHWITPLCIVVATLLYFVTDIVQFEQLWLSNLTTMILFGLFIHSLAHNNFGRTINNRLLNHLGHISYGIYMFHVIALNVVVFFMLKIQKHEIFNTTITILLIYILTFALTILLAHLSNKYFESYFLKLKTKFR
ncbi:acyltransferase family protein [Psychroserpens algicola]|uniref:Acyltransferase n=1 Tax=Psychroserpens algicola TaxID=1719034 RepID=A0ABT0H5W4_9FLAO|nr:acyltransferase [Psychroserpens algicola]MCK8479751.1 acyltransferase [Psychroserpens algicola]